MVLIKFILPRWWFLFSWPICLFYLIQFSVHFDFHKGKQPPFFLFSRSRLFIKDRFWYTSKQHQHELWHRIIILLQYCYSVHKSFLQYFYALKTSWLLHYDHFLDYIFSYKDVFVRLVSFLLYMGIINTLFSKQNLVNLKLCSFFRYCLFCNIISKFYLYRFKLINEKKKITTFFIEDNRQIKFNTFPETLPHHSTNQDCTHRHHHPNLQTVWYQNHHHTSFYPLKTILNTRS